MAFEYRFNAIRFLLKIEPLRFKPSEKTEPFRFKNSSGWFCGLYTGHKHNPNGNLQPFEKEFQNYNKNEEEAQEKYFYGRI